MLNELPFAGPFRHYVHTERTTRCSSVPKMSALPHHGERLTRAVLTHVQFLFGGESTVSVARVHSRRVYRALQTRSGRKLP